MNFKSTLPAMADAGIIANPAMGLIGSDNQSLAASINQANSGNNLGAREFHANDGIKALFS